MSSEDQADAYLREAELTLRAARAIYRAASEEGEALWATVVKNGYDAIEQSISAGIAAEGEPVPRRHGAKIETFLSLYEPPEGFEEFLLEWHRQRSDSQYVDIRGDEVNVPHEQFDAESAERIIEDAVEALEYVSDKVG